MTHQTKTKGASQPITEPKQQTAEPAPRQFQSTLQQKANASARVAQLARVNQMAANYVQRQPNRTGMPDQLKNGIENLSGLVMDDVKVHYNSPKPAQLQAHAYAQGNQIHLGPGQEKHLPHEAWHVVQQKQGRVQPTMQMKGVQINDNEGLEREADVMGTKSLYESDVKLNQEYVQKKSDTNTTQRVQWRSVKGELEPVDPNYIAFYGKMAPEAIAAHMVDGDIWDDQTNVVFSGKTGYMKYPDKSLFTKNELEALPPKTKKAIEEYFPADSNKKLKEFDRRKRKGLENLDPATNKKAYDHLEGMVSEKLFDGMPVPDSGKEAMIYGLASKELYESVINAEESMEDEGKAKTTGKPSDKQSFGLGTLTPKGDSGLEWWASAAMGLRQSEENKGDSSKILLLFVGSGTIPISVSSKASQKGTDYIVLGHDSPIEFDPEQKILKTPASAGEDHKVSYPAFEAKLKKIRPAKGGETKMTDKEIASFMIEMVNSPSEDPAGVLPEDLPYLRELLVTWMVAEPARHKSVIFNSLMTLEMIAFGTITFQDALQDKGIHPMTGAGTAKAGYDSELIEENLTEQKPSTKKGFSENKVNKRQREQLEQFLPEEDKSYSQKLDKLIADYTGKKTKLRYM